MKDFGYTLVAKKENGRKIIKNFKGLVAVKKYLKEKNLIGLKLYKTPINFS